MEECFCPGDIGTSPLLDGWKSSTLLHMAQFQVNFRSNALSNYSGHPSCEWEENNRAPYCSFCQGMVALLWESFVGGNGYTKLNTNKSKTISMSTPPS